MRCSEGVTLFPSETPRAGNVPLRRALFLSSRLSSSRLLLWKAVASEGSMHINKAILDPNDTQYHLADIQDINTHHLEHSSSLTPVAVLHKTASSDTMTNSIHCLVCGVKVCYRLCFYEHYRDFQCHNIDCGLYPAQVRTCIIEGLLCPISYSRQARPPSPPPARTHGFRSAFGDESRESHDRRGRGQSSYASQDPPRESFSHIGVDQERLRDRFRDQGDTRPDIHFRHVHVSTDPEPSIHGYSTRYGDPEMENLSRRFERTSVRDPYEHPTREARPSEREYRDTAYEDGYRRRRPHRDERPAPAAERAPQYSGYWCTEDPDGNVIDEDPCYRPSPPASHVS
ncbi:hypothetical protein QBC34DRAFT_476623 [Podospora aff. communis PSN243]|uniref:Uncharacterized protein n=1 Tax=Podospora aff. communis PSN243 TaxID=3040156 RepID=A0AAV9G8F7_9PEZI|nr:hypothetical protein QBC34DRAFT_476623 [Podospora aff. communis PSN243]